jgi:hypothetical protein
MTLSRSLSWLGTIDTLSHHVPTELVVAALSHNAAYTSSSPVIAASEQPDAFAIGPDGKMYVYLRIASTSCVRVIS